LIHHASPEFWEFYRALPESVRSIADRNFAMLKENPRHPSLRLKRIGRFYSVCVGIGYRALGVEVSGGVLWFWIGNHADYDKLIS
jgi:hypothetical protein